MTFLARRDEQGEQLLIDHLTGAADRAERYLPALAACGRLLGLTHDLGKYCVKFQERLDAKTLGQGEEKRFDHACAGALHIGTFALDPELTELLQAAILGHHGGLPDMVHGKKSPVADRLAGYDKGDYAQAVANAPDTLKETIAALVSLAAAEWEAYRLRLEEAVGSDRSQDDYKVRRAAFMGLTAKLLSSALIDADRRDSARMEETDPQPTDALLKRLDAYVTRLSRGKSGSLNDLRRNVYAACAAAPNAGIVTLDAPTGSGKTLASLGWALSRKRARIVCVLPYISIIEQNAAVAREVLGEAVGESHSYLDREADETDGVFRLVDTYDRPVTYTTMVQFLESVYGWGTNGIRRLHNLTDCALIFDEIQAIPRECVYLFNLLIEFLTVLHGSPVLLSSATDPGLGKLEGDSAFAALPNVTPIEYVCPPLPERAHIFHDDVQSVTDDQKTADLMRRCLEERRSVLTVVNKKEQCAVIYEAIKNESGIRAFYLTTMLCPQHRRAVLAEIGAALQEARNQNGAKVAVVSTQLIEAGVDLDFDCVIRYAAGMDSLVQCAGRCNREGKLTDANGNAVPGTVYVINRQGETLSNLPEIAEGKHWFLHNRARGLSYTGMVEQYFTDKYALPAALTYIFEMQGREVSAINLLSINASCGDAYRLNMWTDRKFAPPVTNRQAFDTVSKHFRVIRAQQKSVVVPYDQKAKEHIERLRQGDLSALKGIGAYTVSLYDTKGYEAAVVKAEGLENIYFAHSWAYDERVGLRPEAQEIII